MTHDFSDAEEWSKEFDAPQRDAWQKPEHVVELMEIEPGMTVADIGAGTGYFLPHLSSAVGADGVVLGLDIERSLVDYMNERAQREGLANVEAKVVPGNDPSLDPGSVDRVIIVDTWHHIPERVDYASKIAKGLKPGGRLFVVDFTLETDKGPNRHHKLAPEVVVKTLTDAGLVARILEEELPDQYIVVGALAE